MIPWFGSIKILYNISNSQINYEKQRIQLAFYYSDL